MKKILSVFSVAAALAFTACAPTKQTEDLSWAKNAIDRASYQLTLQAETFKDSALLPRSIKNGIVRAEDSKEWIKNGSVRLEGPKDWTSGFFPGSLWYQYELTGDTAFKSYATYYTHLLEELQHYTGTHDLGFMMFCSYGNELRLAHDTAAVAPILVNTAKSLSSRFSEKTGTIRSWDFGPWSYPVIIDNMMNLELLFWASNYSGDDTFKNVAVKHADVTMANHFRPDFSSYHVISYDTITGGVESKGTFQGFADESAWARGQAWGVYGYTVMYRFTQDQKYLDQAKHIAAYIMNHPMKTEDLIPYWDYNAPNIPDAPRDASAAAVTACALLEMSQIVENGQEYFDFAEKILKNLSSPAYLAEKDENGGFILKHSVGHLPAGSEIDTPLNYADYYYLEGLKRYLDIKGIDSKTL